MSNGTGGYVGNEQAAMLVAYSIFVTWDLVGVGTKGLGTGLDNILKLLVYRKVDIVLD